MASRPTSWRTTLLIAVAVSAAAVAVLFAAAWLADRADNALGHGPNASHLTGRSAATYGLTLVTGLLGIAGGGATLLSVSLTQHLAVRYRLLPYVALGIPSILLLLVPLDAYPRDPWGGLPPFMVSAPAHAVVGMALGALLFGALDVRRWLPGRWIDRQVATAGIQAAATATRGLPGRFTPGAWRVLSFMQEEAHRFEHSHMGTEHLLLGLIRERQSVAARVLMNLGVELETVRTRVEGIIGRRGSLYTGSGGLTLRCQRVIERAARQAREAGQRQVGTGHLLQSLVDQPEDAAGQMLVEMGVTPDGVEAQMNRLGADTEEVGRSGASS